MKPKKIDMLREIAKAAHDVACAFDINQNNQSAHSKADLANKINRLVNKTFRLVDKPDKLTFTDIGEFDIQKLKVKGGEFECLVNGEKFCGTFGVDVDLGEHTCQLDSFNMYQDLDDKYGPEVTDEMMIYAVSERLEERIQDMAGEYEADAMGAAIDHAHDTMRDGD